MPDVSSLRSLWRDEPRRWKLDPRLAATLFAAPVAGAAMLALLAPWRRMFLFLVNEDGPMEWSQAAVWFIAAVLAAIVTWRLARDRRWALAALWAVLATGCFLSAGEEISWGQRVFGFETPERLEEANEQDEVTFHNLGAVHVMFRLTMLIAGLYGSVLAVGIRLWDRGRYDEVLDLIVPPMFLTTWFAVLFVYRAVRMLFLPDPGPMISGYGEFPETCLAAGIALFTLLVFRRYRRRTAEGLPRPSLIARIRH